MSKSRWSERGDIGADNLVPWKARILLTLGLTKTSDPQERALGLCAVQPEPTRVPWQTRTLFPRALARASSSPGLARPAPVPAEDDRPSASRHCRVDSATVGADVADDEIDTGEVRAQLVDVEVGRSGVRPNGPVIVENPTVGIGVAERAEVATLECLDAVRRRLRDVAHALDRVVEDDQYAHPA